ncbi:DUF2019 domain-containing protein [Archangium violaceum]|nr:DUF2019 domain-containing protein [Archangium violaceum]
MVTNLEKWVEDFARHVEAQTAAIWRGDAKTGNKHAERCLAAFDKLCAHGDSGRDALATLFTHPNMDVRTTAAARAILEEAAKGEGLVAFAASQTLKRWEEGSWALDPAEDAAGQPESPRAAPPGKRSRPHTERAVAATDRRRGGKRDKPGG